MNTINHKIKKTALAQVFAVVAAIFIAYISFMGLVYLSHGQIVASAIAATALGITMVLLCFMAQQMKGTGEKFAGSIVKERIAIVSLAFVMMVPVVPFLHFFSVSGRETRVTRQFDNALAEVMPMFDEYDSIVDKRVANYRKRLSGVKNKQSKNFAKYGFNKHTEGMPSNGVAVMRGNMVNTLRTMLAPPALDSLRQDARQWVEKAHDGSSVWNVFLLGNSDLTASAVASWQKTMDTSLRQRLNNEVADTTGFESAHATMALERLSQLSDECARFSMPPFYAIPLLLAALLLLFFPYWLQTRHSKSWERLGGKRKTPQPDWSVVMPRQAKLQQMDETKP
ncbi:MAG: hypothetical protein J5637_05550 [Prevotella sp.]|nr:hypothetical protein [Prevotella sp.]